MNALAPTKLTFDEAKALTEQIKTATVDLWELIQRAHDGKAWAAIGYPTWESYVTTEFQMSKQRAYQFLDYAKVRELLCADGESTVVDLNERQARELRGLEPELAREVLKAAKDTAAETGRPVTAAHVKAAVRAKRNGIEPPHAPGTITDAELDAGDKGDPVWLSTFHFRECDEAQQIKAAGLFFNDMKPKNQVLVTALYLSAMSPEQLAELGHRIDFRAFLEAGKL